MKILNLESIGTDLLTSWILFLDLQAIFYSSNRLISGVMLGSDDRWSSGRRDMWKYLIKYLYNNYKRGIIILNPLWHG